jgi:hypothetical protein
MIVRQKADGARAEQGIHRGPEPYGALSRHAVQIGLQANVDGLERDTPVPGKEVSIPCLVARVSSRA